MKQERLLKAVERYCKGIVTDNHRVTEIGLIGSLVNGGFNDKSDIDLVCVFEPDFEDEGQAYFAVRQLLEKHGCDIKGYPVDLGFITERGEIFLGGGLVGSYTGEYRIMADGQKQGLAEL